MAKQDQKDEVEITAIFPVDSGKSVFVHLSTFEWDFTAYGPVILCLDSEQVHMQYVACGNQEDEAILKLRLVDDRYENTLEVIRLPHARKASLRRVAGV